MTKQSTANNHRAAPAFRNFSVLDPKANRSVAPCNAVAQAAPEHTDTPRLPRGLGRALQRLAPEQPTRRVDLGIFGPGERVRLMELLIRYVGHGLRFEHIHHSLHCMATETDAERARALAAGWHDGLQHGYTLAVGPGPLRWRPVLVSDDALTIELPFLSERMRAALPALFQRNSFGDVLENDGVFYATVARRAATYIRTFLAAWSVGACDPDSVDVGCLKTRHDPGPEDWLAGCGDVTCIQYGTMPVWRMLQVPGASDEHEAWDTEGAGTGRYGEQEWSDFCIDIASVGILQPLCVHAHQHGGFALWEGNHRLRAAYQMGLRRVPVEVKYFAHSERLGLLDNGAWTPG